MKRRRQRQEPELAVEYGSDVVGPSREQVKSAVDALNPDMSWRELQEGLRPVFIRRRPLPPGIERPVTVTKPPGLDVALAVDIGPAFMYVGHKMLESWSVSMDHAFDRAIANLRRQADEERYVEMEYELIDGVPFWWYQSHGGLASGLLLLEDELGRRYGDEPRLLIAPMRNLLIAAPFDADRELVGWVRDEVSAEDPNGLDLPIFALLNGRLTIDSRARRGERARVH